MPKICFSCPAAIIIIPFISRSVVPDYTVACQRILGAADLDMKPENKLGQGQREIKHYHIFTVKYVLFTYAIQAQVLCTYRDTISRKLYQFKICQNPYLPREIWPHITPPYHTPNLESCISSKFVKIHISLGRYGLISHPHITPQTSYHISRDPHIRSALFYSIVRCKLFSIYKSNFCI